MVISMTEQTRSVLEAALKLPLAERAEVAAALLASMDGEDGEGVAAAWDAEIDRRVRRVLDGEPGIPWEQVEAEARARLRRD
jgi:putative addiction module component (TIGR02574 family)